MGYLTAPSLHLCWGVGGSVSPVNVLRPNEDNRIRRDSFHGRRKNVCCQLSAVERADSKPSNVLLPTPPHLTETSRLQELKEPIAAASALLGKRDSGSKMHLSSLMAAVSNDLQHLNDNLQAIQGGRSPNWPFEEKFSLSTKASSILEEKTKWTDLDLDIHRWIRSSRIVQWYPGHIAKAERELKQQLKLMDVVVEVRDARIPMATGHPEMDSWIGERKKILVLNREDMISTADKNAWAAYFSRQGITVIFANGRLGMGTMKLARVAKSLADNVNTKRRAKGLLPRAVRAGVVGYPNVGKSSLINRLLKRKVCATAPRPGVTRELKWIRIGKDLDLLDSPGILPLRFNDQAAATKLAICDDIGERSYAVAGVATILIEMLKQIPTAGASVLHERYKIDADGCSGEIFLKALGHRLFNGDVNQAAFRILQDFRKGKFGWIALERPTSSSSKAPT